MNPSTLMKIFRSEGQLTSLGFLVADDVIPELNDALSGHNVYWLNRYSYAHTGMKYIQCITPMKNIGKWSWF